VTEIKKLDFNDGMCVETYLCIYDDFDKKYIIDGIVVSPQEAMEYIESNNEKPDVEWHEVNKENLDRLGSSSPSVSISTPGTDSVKSDEGGNPIDEYYLPLIESADSEASLRTLQNEYRKAWEKEFNNITGYLLKKCIYESDKEQIKEMKKGFRKNVMNLKRVMKTELIDAYQVDPENNSGNEYTRLSLEGNGTRSRLAFLEAQMYRDACIRMLEMCEDYIIVF